MDSSTLALKILSAGHAPIPPTVAANLLAAVAEDKVPAGLLNAAGFSGQDAYNVAITSKRKARLVAANTTDQRLLRRLFESVSIQVEVLKAIAETNAVTDPELLVDIHRLVWEERPGAADYESARRWIVRTVPLDYQLGYLGRVVQQQEGPHGHRPRYELRPVAYRLGTAAAQGETWFFGELESLLAGLRRYPNGDSVGDDFIEVMADRIGVLTPPVELATRLRTLQDGLSLDLARQLVTTAVAGAPYIDEDALTVQLEYLAVLDGDVTDRRDCRSGDRRHHAVPNLLYRRTRAYSLQAAKLLASTYPAALVDVAKNLEVDDVDYREMVEVALDTECKDVAHALLNRSTTKGDRPNRTVLDAEQFHRALDVYDNGWSDPARQHSQLTFTEDGAARTIPADAADADVAALLRHLQRPGPVLRKLLTCTDPAQVSYTPTPGALRALVEVTAESARQSIAESVLYCWDQATARSATSVGPVAASTRRLDLDEIVTVAADAVPAESLVASIDGYRYVGHRLAAELGDDHDRWSTALGLLPTARMSISKVIAAAKRL